MSWAKFAIEGLRKGEMVQIRPRGHSMRGKVNDGDVVTLEPCDPAMLQVGDIVLVRVRGRDYLHLIRAMQGGRFQIGNNRGHINGWVEHSCIYGRATRVETFYVVAIASELETASWATHKLLQLGLSAKVGEGSRVWGFTICCVEFEQARAAITSDTAYRTGDIDLFVLSHPTPDGKAGHTDDLAGLASYRQHMQRREMIRSGRSVDHEDPSSSKPPDPVRSKC